ncbi:MAG: phage replisome organizer N-terminal domain-containing protein, partial [Ignavibacteriaceae bacterium]
MFDDEKIQLIEAMPEADAILVIWIKILILAGKTNTNGYVMLAENIPYSTEMLSTIFRRPLQIVKFALKILLDFGMIEITESNVICVTNWQKHQNIEGMDKLRAQNALRQAKYREQKKLISSQNQTNSNATVTLRNAIELELELDKEVLMREFENFWNLYNKKVDRKKCFQLWKKVKKTDKEKIFNTLPKYIENTPDLKFRRVGRGEFHPSTPGRRVAQFATQTPTEPGVRISRTWLFRDCF